jgi:hypothetical protein
MSSDPLARPDIWAGAPNEAEYDAVYAAVAATGRGRWFLSEFATRNRHADTEALTGALARVEAAIRGERTAQSPADSVVMPKPIQTPDIVTAIERILDIAFMLRERGVDAALCDALDDAARELSGPRGNSNGAVPPGRLSDGDESAEAEIDEDPLSPGPLFTMDVRDQEKFVQAIAGLAASPHSDDRATTSNAEGEPRNRVLPQPDYDNSSEPPPDRRPRSYIAPPEFELHTTDRQTNEQRASESGQAHALLPEARLPPGPQEDPADLFEPPADRIVAPVAKVPAPTVLVMPRPAVADPLAGIRILSEEELIALFG